MPVTYPKHPLVRDGKSQHERLKSKTLAPENVHLDDRSERQLLVYLNEFAKSVAYYEYPETKDSNETTTQSLQQSNWQNFFKTSGSVQVSLIENFDAAGFEQAFSTKKQFYTEGLTRADRFPLFDFLFESAFMVNAWYDALASDEVLLDNQIFKNESPLQRTIANLIRSNLSAALAQLVSIANLFVRLDETSYQLPNLSVLSSDKKTFWQIDPSVLSARDVVLMQLQDKPIAFEQQFRERLDNVLRIFAKVIRQIIEAATEQDIRQETGTHPPHLALLYTFLRLFKYLNDDLNSLTQKHLDFYYRKVLALKPKPLTPDAAHVIFELPKTTPQYKVEKNTLLKDGKDAKGAEVRFSLDNELVVGRTQVAELRTLFCDNKLYARPKADSADGLGGPFKEEEGKTNAWKTLGVSNDREDTYAQIGWIVASPTLLLESGERKVILTLVANSAFPTITKSQISIQLSGKKGWFLPKDTTLTKVETLNNQLVVEFTLQVGEEPIVEANPSVLGVDYGEKGVGIVRIFIHQADKLYNDLKVLKFQQTDITVNVSKLQNVKIRTDEGDQDPTKPFMPFGAVPSVGATFSVGSEEIFSKDISSFKVNYEWDKEPTDFEAYYHSYKIVTGVTPPTGDGSFNRTVFFFKNGEFKQIPESGTNLFSLPLTVANTAELPVLADTAAPSVSIAKDAAWQAGFVMIKLQNDFLHQYYTEALTRKALGKAIELNDLSNPNARAFIKVSDIENVKHAITNLPIGIPAATADQNTQNTNITNFANDLKNRSKSQVDTLHFDKIADVIINPPYTPIIKNLSVEYTATATGVKTFHICPFDGGKNFEAVSKDKSLIFSFKQSGALLIGLSDAVDNSLVPILFQLLESSAATNVDKAQPKWHFLNGNNWETLELGQQLLNDGTDGLIQSGIVDIILPERKNVSKTTVLPPQYYWLKISVTGDISSVCHTIGIHTQVARVTFQPTANNDPNRLAEPLAAKSIAKLDTPDPNIKSIIQPYPSFGGLPTEDDPHFYRRVSERLRHKGRAVTLFDYEQLILEAFPEVFKVKCINHTFSDITANLNNDNLLIRDMQNAGGHVTVVVVPDNTRNMLEFPEKPTASWGLLARIEAFLKKRISPFVRLKVLNPLYDEISVEAEVKFKVGRSPEYYANQLSIDLRHHLAPWAYDPTAQVTFGGVVYQSSIVGFIENRDYVDFVSDFKFIPSKLQKADLEKLTELNTERNLLLKDATAIRAASERVVLTTGTHKIEPYKLDSRTPNTPSVNQGIGNTWTVGGTKLLT
ncbi:MAG: baseplate J/gp47 family protein [Saprospiraceae bacterium]|nr:baseplate J/gp47 family protein [Saprospiraceae bacterium]